MPPIYSLCFYSFSLCAGVVGVALHSLSRAFLIVNQPAHLWSIYSSIQQYIYPCLSMSQNHYMPVCIPALLLPASKSYHHAHTPAFIPTWPHFATHLHSRVVSSIWVLQLFVTKYSAQCEHGPHPPSPTQAKILTCTAWANSLENYRRPLVSVHPSNMYLSQGGPCLQTLYPGHTWNPA